MVIEDDAGLRAALKAANVPTLLMVYVHLSHDETMLERFAPHIRSPYSMEPATTPAALEDELRNRLFDLLHNSQPPQYTLPPADLMSRMMSVNVGEPVSQEFMPLLLEQMGFVRPLPRTAIEGRTAPAADFKVLVIGAGLAGIAAAIKLEEAGYDHLVIEKNPDIGGTWYENRYPGVGVDTPSHFYSYSFEINTEWNHYHPKGQDMQAYLLHVADKYRVRDRTMFNSRVIACVYDEVRAKWSVTVRVGATEEKVIEGNAIFLGHGPLNRWELPEIPGLGDFRGPAMHTAAWDTSVDVAGKRVVMIGTGASGHQLAPAIAPDADHLTICQRSPRWVMRNPEIGAAVGEDVKFALRNIPFYKEWFRFRVYWFAGDGLFVNVIKDPNWPHQNRSVSAHNDAMREYALHHLHTSLREHPELIEKLTPDYPIFAQRILQDEGWLATLKRNNVSLETRSIDHIESDCVVMQDGTRHAADIIALATGFNVARMLGPLIVIGRDGRCLGDEWGEDDPRSYLGVTVPGYPNFFLSVGPNSAPNHAAGQNLISESQINYMIECLDVLVAAGKSSIEPKQEAFETWNAMIDDRMQEMIWTHPKADSYYNNKAGRIYLAWPYRLVDYWTEMRTPDLANFEVR